MSETFISADKAVETLASYLLHVPLSFIFTKNFKRLLEKSQLQRESKVTFRNVISFTVRKWKGEKEEND